MVLHGRALVEEGLTIVSPTRTPPPDGTGYLPEPDRDPALRRGAVARRGRPHPWIAVASPALSANNDETPVLSRITVGRWKVSQDDQRHEHSVFGSGRVGEGA